MISWRDIGYVLSVKPGKDINNIVFIFTKEHGKVAGLIQKHLIISNFSQVEVLYTSKYTNKLGYFKILKYREVWVHFLFNKIKIEMLNNICRTLNLVLPLDSNEYEIYALTDSVYHAICYEQDMLKLYNVFRKSLLNLLGFGNDPKKEPLIAKVNTMLSIQLAVNTQ